MKTRGKNNESWEKDVFVQESRGEFIRGFQEFKIGEKIDSRDQYSIKKKQNAIEIYNCLTNEKKNINREEIYKGQKSEYRANYLKIFAEDNNAFRVKYGEFQNYIHNNKRNYFLGDLILRDKKEKLNRIRSLKGNEEIDNSFMSKNHGFPKSFLRENPSLRKSQKSKNLTKQNLNDSFIDQSFKLPYSDLKQENYHIYEEKNDLIKEFDEFEVKVKKYKDLERQRIKNLVLTPAPASTNTEQSSEKVSDQTKVQDPLDGLINKIYEYAAELAKVKEDPEKRKLKRGIVSNFYPKIQRDLLKKNAQKQKNQGSLLKYLTDPYRFCIFPYSESNAMTYCDNTFKRLSTSRSSDCKHLMCINCCDHLLYVLKYSALESQSPVSKTLGLSGDSGFTKIKGFISPDMSDQCRTACDKEYPVEEPLILPPPPKDPTLGKLQDNPGKSCMDIKVNGINAKDGTYFLKSGKKPVFKAYCDMTTDGGGWTLFYSYNHHPFEDYDLDGTKLPIDPLYGRSHLHLEEAGFDAFDVTELRFFCMSNHGPKFIHYRSHDVGLIKTAMNGDQTYTKPSSYQKNKQNMNIPKDNKYFNLVRDRLPDTVSQVNKNKNGGFWDSPFASSEGGWTIKGDVKSGGRWECGDILDSVSGSKYETVHQVWFRGQSPSKEFLEARLLDKTTKIQ